MKYGAPEEIRTPDPQIRSLATRKNHLLKSIACADIVFRKFAKSLILAASVSACAHTPTEVRSDRDGRIIVSPKPKPRPANRWVNHDGTHGYIVDDTCMGGCPPKQRYVVKP